jgi:hypothetical protein
MAPAVVTTDAAPRGASGRAALRLLMVGVGGVALAYASAFTTGPLARGGSWLMALTMPLVLVSTMALGAQRAGQRHRGLVLALTLTYGVVAGGFLLGLALPAETVEAPLWWGLPRRAFLVLAGAGAIPLVMLPLVYARLFSAVTLRDVDLQRVRDAAKAQPQ